MNGEIYFLKKRLKLFKNSIPMSSRSSLNSRQKRMVRSLCQFITCSERDAIGLLQKTNWDVQAAATIFFENQQANAVDVKKIDKWFNTYLEEGEENEMEAEGVEKFCNDIGVDGETDTIILGIAWKMEASDMGIFTRAEFQKGMAALGCETASALKEKLPALRSEVADPWSFKKMYTFCHKFAVDPDVHKRNLPLDTAIAYWNLLLSEKFHHLELWIEFLEASRAEVKFISKDQWVQLLEFANTMGSGNFDAFKEGEEWPVLLDDFVAWARPKMVGKSAGGEKKDE